MIGNNSKSMMFFRPEQTSTKSQPMLYTMSQPTYARSLFPIMDSPSVKATWSAVINAPNTVEDVFMSGFRTKVEEHEDYTTYSFR